MLGIKQMRMNMKTSLTPVGKTVETNPNLRMNSLRSAISQRRRGLVAKNKVLTQNTQRPLNLDQGKDNSLDLKDFEDSNGSFPV